MLRSHEENDEDGNAPHPYWYARVLGIYHTNIYVAGQREPRRMEFLWVRWFGRDPDWSSGPTTCRLDRVGFVPEEDPEAFGFLDPMEVLRACHLIPAFSQGRTTDLLGPSIAREDPSGDYVNYYVMRSVQT
jgi:hypothetical protein